MSGNTAEMEVVFEIWKHADGKIKPLNLLQCNLEVLSDSLAHAATSTMKYEKKYMDYLFDLAENMTVSWTQVLRSIVKKQRDGKFELSIELCKVVLRVLPRLQLESFLDKNNSVDRLVDTVTECFAWAANVCDTILFEYVDEDNPNAHQYPFAVLHSLVDSKFTGPILAMDHKEAVSKIINDFIERLDSDKPSDELSKKAILLIKEMHEKNRNIPRFTIVDNSTTLFGMKNASFKVLTTVLSCFRVTVSAEEMSEMFRILLILMKLKFEDLVYDMVHSSLLAKCEESVDLPNLPRKRRMDFRWHISSFYYLRMTKIWATLIKKYNHSKQDLVTALKKVVTTLSMSLDIADHGWKDCSIRSIILQLVEMDMMTQVDADQLIAMRIEHMNKQADLVAYTKPIGASDQEATDNKLENDYSILKSSMETAKLMNFNNEAAPATEKVKSTAGSFITSENASTFDSFVGTMCFQGNIIDYSLELAALNQRCNTEKTEPIAERMETFDQTFLLLTRLAVKWPSLKLELLMGEGREETVDCVFFDWAKRYLKRVTVQQQVIIHDDKELEQLKNQLNEENPEQVVVELDGEENTGTDRQDDNTNEPGPSNDNDNEEEQPLLASIGEKEFPLPSIPMEEAKANLQKLKEKQPFWDVSDESLDFSKLVCAIPQIGKLLLEEHEGKKKQSDKEAAIQGVMSIIEGLKDMSSLIVCLVQWLDCEKESAARKSLAFTLQQALERSSGVLNQKLPFIISTFRPIMIEMIEQVSLFPEIASSVFNSAKRFAPHLGRNEAPNVPQLKQVWYCMQVHEWTSPHCLRLIEHSNQAEQNAVWGSVFVNKTLKTKCGDQIRKFSDMICAMAFINHMKSLKPIYDALFDYMFCDATEYDGRFDPNSFLPVVKLMSILMVLMQWAIDKDFNPSFGNGDEPPKKRRKEDLLEEALANLCRNTNKDVKDITNTISRAIDCMDQTTRSGGLSPFVCMTNHTLQEIASFPDCEARTNLIRNIHPRMIFRLAYIDPSSVSLALLNEYCFMDMEEHMTQKYKFLCALRRRQLI